MSRLRIKSAAFILLALVVLASATTSWLLGSELVQPAMHPVPLPIGFAAQQVTIPSQGHAIAGWWIDNHANTPVVLLLPGIRADRSSMASRATVLAPVGSLCCSSIFKRTAKLPERKSPLVGGNRATLKPRSGG